MSYTSAVKCVGEAHMTGLLESLTALLEYLDLLQFSVLNFNVFTEAVASVSSMVYSYAFAIFLSNIIM